MGKFILYSILLLQEQVSITFIKYRKLVSDSPSIFSGVHVAQSFFLCSIRDRPFNLKGEEGGYGFLFRSEFFFLTARVRIYFFLLHEARIFFPEFNIRLYDKNSESDYFFFPSPKSEYFFQQHWESEYFFRKKP